MTGSLITSCVALFLALIAALIVFYRARLRTADDVLEDLEDELFEHNASENRLHLEELLLSARNSPLSNPALLELGIFDATERRQYRIRKTLIPTFTGLLAVVMASLLTRGAISNFLVFGIVGWALGYLFSKAHDRNLRHQFKRNLEFFLPLVMERIVMAVQAGLDIVPALQVVVEENQSEQKSGISKLDPVSRLLKVALRLTERGMGFERSLREVAARISSSALKHAFIHLGIAQRDGGELVLPLRELSDSTHLYYQESIEEEIAKMPVKATMPLLCTFAGLIIFFITAPIVQIISITQTIPGK